MKVWLVVPSWSVAVMMTARLPACSAGVPVMAAWPFPVLVNLSPLAASLIRSGPAWDSRWR